MFVFLLVFVFVIEVAKSSYSCGGILVLEDCDRDNRVSDWLWYFKYLILPKASLCSFTSIIKDKAFKYSFSNLSNWHYADFSALRLIFRTMWYQLILIFLPFHPWAETRQNYVRQEPDDDIKSIKRIKGYALYIVKHFLNPLEVIFHPIYVIPVRTFWKLS